MIRERLGERKLRSVTWAFERFGGIAISLPNLVPGLRCMVIVPAGLTQYPVGRLLFFAFVGNVLYVSLLVPVAFGMLEAAKISPVP